MPHYQVAYDAATHEALIQAYGDDTVAGHTNIGSFYHGGGGNDVIDGNVEGTYVGDHTLLHHVQDLLYNPAAVPPVLDMVPVKIVYKHVTAIDASVVDAAMNTSTDTTEQIVVAFTPADAANRGLTYSSSDVTKATVSSTGLITAIAAGSPVITVTSVDGGFTDTVAITVS